MSRVAHNQDSPAAPLVVALRRLRAAVRRRLTLQSLSAVAAGSVIATLLVIGLDYAARFPQGLRIGLWAIGVAATALALHRLVWPALRFSPSLVELALRVERTPEARRAGLQGRLASAVELAQSVGSSLEGEMARSVVSETAARFGGVHAGSAIVNSARAQRGLLALAAALIPVLVLFVLAPEHAMIGTRRVLTPWADVSWPKRTRVVNETSLTAHPLDSALTLRAVLVLTDKPAGKTNVAAVYRVISDGKPGPTTRLLLNAQRGGGNGSPEQYEATIGRDTLRLAAGLSSAGDAGATPRSLEYWFETPDDATPAARVILAERPAVVAARGKVTPPDYAKGAASVVSGEQELAVDAARRRPVGPVLAGSEVEVEFVLNKPVPTPGASDSPAPTDAPMPHEDEWRAATFGDGAIPQDAEVVVAADRWLVRWKAMSPVTLRVRPTDQFGISALEEAIFSVGVIDDAKPVAMVVEPSQDESVLATALLAAAGEGRDDVGLALVALEAQKLSPPAGSQGAAPEPFGPAAELASVQPAGGGVKVTADGPSRPTARAAADLDLSTMSLHPGDEVWLTAVAKDRFALGAEVHEAARSAPRRLRVIGESQFVEQILQELAALKPAAQRLDQEQGDVSKQSADAARAEASSQDRRASEHRQRGIGERLSPAADLVKRAKDRVERNALADESLKSLLTDAGNLVNDAREASKNAEEALAQSAAAPEGQQAPRESAEAAAKAQAQVRDDLGKLSDLLSRGQDGYAARQSVERLLTDQKDLAQQTKDIGEQTAGRSPGELTPEQKTELERIARQEEDLARRAEGVAQDLARRAERSAKSDPSQSAAMQRARETALREQLAETMREASKQAQQNQTGQASQGQQQAQRTMEQMLQELDKAQSRRDQELKRMLAGMIQAIEALIARQQTELTALEKAEAGGALAGLDGGMTALHNNTIAVIETTDAREIEEVKARLTAAAEHQESAVGALKEPFDALEADKNERMSLKRLEEARDLAQELEKQADKRDQDRKRGELRKSYEKLAGEQTKVRDDTRPYVAKDLTRRERNALKGLSARQAELRQKLAEIRESTTEIGEAETFEYAHKRMDTLAQSAADKLGAGEAPARLGRDQDSLVAILQSLIEALKEEDGGKPKPFREPGQSSGGGQGQGQGNGQPDPVVPDIAQLKQLRAMQREAAARTRAAGEGPPEADELQDIGQLQRDLADIAKRLADKLNSQGKQPGGGGGGGGGDGGKQPQSPIREGAVR